ncbi:MAG: DUF1116 domain-containing protein [Candidatus Rokubacteria bacterium]|nr:DUF1116 domain-containing protein [Candidatus Rokubacteria bacterium]
MTTPAPFLGGETRVVNIGLSLFAETLAALGVSVVSVDWRPPAGGDRRLAELLARAGDEAGAKPVTIADANRECLRRIQAGTATLVGLRPAREVVPGLGERTVLHAGPPVTWERMCGPMRGAIIGACLFEGWAKTPDDAVTLAESGALTFDPCHHHRAVGPMAGIVTPSMAVWVVENDACDTAAYATLNEGVGKVLRFGAYDRPVLDRFAWINRELAPILDGALRRAGGLDAKTLIARALTMGDECHNRTTAATSLLARELAPHVAAARAGDVEKALAFLARTDHFFLNIAMAACKAVLDGAHGIRGATVVTAMARNGVEFGIRASGTGDRWFTAPAPNVTGLYFPGYGPGDASPDLGDSAITEAAGLGGFAMAAAPAVVQFVGGTAELALDTTRRMYEITLGEHETFRIPALDFRGAPLGIDIRRVVETGIAPAIDTGLAHREAGVGQVGAGIAEAPIACFVQALEAFVAGLPA